MKKQASNPVAAVMAGGVLFAVYKSTKKMVKKYSGGGGGNRFSIRKTQLSNFKNAFNFTR